MKAAWYERQGGADDVLQVGSLPDPTPQAGEVRIRLAFSGINPGDVKKRTDAFGYGMSYPRVIPHSDGSGFIDQVGEGVAGERLGERVWCFGAQSYRPFGTAAEYVVVPESHAVALADHIELAVGATLGIPGITAHRAVHAAGDVRHKTVWVQGAGGAVADCAIALARHAGAQVIATSRSEQGASSGLAAGAQVALRTDQAHMASTIEHLQKLRPDHIVEVDLAGNIDMDEKVLGVGGTIASYASSAADTTIPFWRLLFKNITLHLLGSDDFPLTAKVEAAKAINQTLAAGWPGPAIAEVFKLEQIAAAHRAVECGTAGKGRIVVTLGEGPA